MDDDRPIRKRCVVTIRRPFQTIRQAEFQKCGWDEMHTGLHPMKGGSQKVLLSNLPAQKTALSLLKDHRRSPQLRQKERL